MFRKVGFPVLFAFALLPAAIPFAARVVGVSPWYSVGHLNASDATEGEDVVLAYDGGVRTPFLGSYTVVVRREGTGEIVCDARGGPFDYKRKSRRPDDLRLSWWAPSDPRCARLPSGRFIIQTCWTVHSPLGGWFRDVTECVRSNAFSVN